MLTKEQILALRPKIDVVFTNIPPETGLFANGSWRTVKFDSLIVQAKLKWIKDKATLVFYRMVDLGFYCPRIVLFYYKNEANCIRLRWEEEDRVIAIDLHSDGRHTVTLGIGVNSTSISSYDPINDFVNALEALKDDTGSTYKKPDSREKHLD